MKKIILHNILFLCFVSSISSVYSQNPEWMQYTCCERVTVLVEEGNYIWAGTFTGLYKIDKTTEESICYNNANSELPGNDIAAIAIDSNGIKWIGTKGGLAKFDGTSGAFIIRPTRSCPIIV